MPELSSFPLLQLENITHVFQSPLPDQPPLKIFQNISLELYPGKSLAITGASGEGKSTLLHIIGALEKPTSGLMLWQNKPISPKRQEIGFIFQQFHLLDDLSVWENILLPLRLQNSRPDPSSIERAQQILHRVGLSHRKNQMASLLSGGEKQRCAIARALVGSAKLVLADEPTGNLDHHTAGQIAKLLFEMVKEEGVSLILVTHDHALASRCDSVLKLENGHLLKPLE
jgi:putative ABC transport system ATP-binding protein